MKTKVNLMIIMLLTGSMLYAQDYTQTVKGKITDLDTKVPLPGASIILVGSSPLVGTITDLDGNFKLEKIPVGRRSFEVSYLGYEKVYISEVLIGTGRNYGVEITLEKFFSDNFYMLTTASLFESKYTMPDGVERNTFFNSRYIFNVVGGKEFKVGKDKQNIIGANLRTMWRGGYRNVPIDLEASRQMQSEVRNYAQAFETKIPDYFRVDVGTSFRKNKSNWAWVLSLDIQNVTNRSNIWDENYDPEKQMVEQTYMVGLVPVLNYRVEF